MAIQLVYIAHSSFCYNHATKLRQGQLRFFFMCFLITVYLCLPEHDGLVRAGRPNQQVRVQVGVQVHGTRQREAKAPEVECKIWV